MPHKKAAKGYKKVKKHLTNGCGYVTLSMEIFPAALDAQERRDPPVSAATTEYPDFFKTDTVAVIAALANLPD